jgi:hypothetical protein
MLVEKDREIEQLKGIVAQEEDEEDSDKKEAGESGATDSVDKRSTGSLKSAKSNSMSTSEIPIDKSYLKVALIRYLEYAAKGEEKDALTMEKVLFTVLGATGLDLVELEKARVNKKSGIMSYFYGSNTAIIAKPAILRTAEAASPSPPRKGKQRIDNLFN